MANEFEDREKWERKNNTYLTLFAKVQTLHQTNKKSAEMNVGELKVLCSWFKRPGDLALPTTRNLLITKLDETIVQGDQLPPPMPVDLPNVAAPDGAAIFI